MRRTGFALLYTAFAVLANLGTAAKADPEALAALRDGDMRKLAFHEAPQRGSDVAFVSQDGGEMTLADYAGKHVVLNFWATWCAPCRIEMPSLQSLQEDRGEDGVVVLALSTDVGPETPIRRFVEERGFTFPVGRATNAHRSAFGGIAGIPTTYLIDRSGVVRHRVVGYFAPPALRVAVGRLVDEPAHPAP